MAVYDLGIARGRIDIETGSAERNLDSLQRKQKLGDKAAGSTSQAFRAIGFGMAGIGAAAVAGFGLAISKAADFEKGMSAIKAVSGATEGQMEKVRKKALQLGADTKFSAGEASQAMEELIKAGISVEDTLNGAADATVALAAAGEIDLPQAATISANAMNAFNLAAKDLPHVADLIAGAANASAIDVGEFGQSMQQAAATAHLSGLSFDDMTVAIAAMGNAGIKGSDAGTSLKTFLSNLIPVTEKQISLSKELGLVTEDGANQFFDASGKVKTMSEIGGVLAKSLKGLSNEQKLATLNTLFGSDAIRAASVIADTGAKGFDKLSQNIGKVKAADVAATRMDNLQGSIEQLKGSLETLLIQVGTPFLQAIRGIVDQFTKFTNVLSGLNPNVQKFAAFATLAAGALIGLGGVLILAFQYIQRIQAVLKVLQLGSLLTNPVFLAIAAIAALVLGLILLYKHSARARAIMQTVFEFFLPAIQAVQAWIERVIHGVQWLINMFKQGRGSVDLVASALDRLTGGTGVVAAIINTISEALKTFAGWVATIVQRLGGWKAVLKDAAIALAALLFPIPALIAGIVLLWRNSETFRNAIFAVIDAVVAAGLALRDFGLAVADVAQQVFAWFNKNVFPTFFALGELVVAVVKLIIKVVKFMLPIWKTEIRGMLTIAGVVFTAIRTIVSVALTQIKAVITVVLGVIKILWQNFGQNLLDVITLVFNNIKAVVEFALGLIRGIIQIVTGLLTGDWSKAWEGVKTIVGSAFKFIKAIITNTMKAVQLAISIALHIIHAAWQGALLLLQTIIKTAWTIIKTVIKGAMDAIKGAVSGGIATIIQFFKSFPGQVLSALGNLALTLLKAGVSLVQGFFSGILDQAHFIIQYFLKLPGVLLGLLGDLGRTLFNAGVALIKGLIDGIGSMAGKLKDAVVAIPKKVIGWFPNSPKAKQGPLKTHPPESWGQAIVRGLADGLGAAAPMLNKALAATTGSLNSSLVGTSVGSSSSGGGDNFTVIVKLGGDTDLNTPGRVKQAVLSPEVLRELTAAVRAGRN